MTLLLEGGSSLSPCREISYSPIKLLEFSFQPIKRRYLDSCCCCIQKAVDEVLSSRGFDGSILFLHRKIIA